MKAIITIDLDSEHVQRWLEDDKEKDIPREVVYYLDQCTITELGAIIDRNGNTIGRVEIEP